MSYKPIQGHFGWWGWNYCKNCFLIIYIGTLPYILPETRTKSPARHLLHLTAIVSRCHLQIILYSVFCGPCGKEFLKHLFFLSFLLSFFNNKKKIYILSSITHNNSFSYYTYIKSISADVSFLWIPTSTHNPRPMELIISSATVQYKNASIKMSCSAFIKFPLITSQI